MKTFKLIIAIAIISFLSSCTDDNIIEAPVFPPPMVENLTATPGNARVTLNWDSGNTDLFTNYSLSYSPSDGEPITIENTETTFIVNGLTNDTEYTFELVTQNISQANSQSSEPTIIKATPFEPDTNGPEISAFNFLSALNSNMALAVEDRVDLTGEIDLENNIINFNEDNVSAYVYRDALVPSFEVPDGATVEVNGVTQISGESVQDFTTPVTYDISLNGETRSYVVTVNKNKFATIPDDNFRDELMNLGMPFNEEYKLDISSTLVTDYAIDDKINLDNIGIANIKGIEFFTGAKEIDAERNTFGSINLSRNVGMKNLLVGLNPNINNIAIGNLTGIEIIYMNDAPNIDESVAQAIINANAGLKRFYAQGVGTGLASISVDNLTSMERLRLNESTASASATSINSMLNQNPPIASDLGNLRIYNDADGSQCGSYDPFTYQCQ